MRYCMPLRKKKFLLVARMGIRVVRTLYMNCEDGTVAASQVKKFMQSFAKYNKRAAKREKITKEEGEEMKQADKEK